MAENKPPKKADTKLLLVSWGLGLALVVFYVGYWVFVAHKIETQLEARKNADFSFTSAKISGFPYRFTLTIKELNAKIGQVTLLRAEEFSASASTFEPQLWVLEGAARPSIWLDNPAYSDTVAFQFELKPNNFQASVRFDPKSREIERLSIQFSGIASSGSQYPEIFSMGRGEVHLIKDNTNNNYAFSVDLNAVTNSLNTSLPNRLLLRGLLNNPQNLNRNWDYWTKNGGIIDIKYGMFGEKTGVQYADNMRGKLYFNSEGKFSGKINADIELSLGPHRFGPFNGSMYLKDSEVDEPATAQELMEIEAFRQHEALLFSGRTF
ncbi:MAG: hypothetical protein FD163_304 [Hyphomonadaceae bacterium]|nr:MAG: hypothetical protein FD128_149 [Hyphomonadaceae bacterium]KAF0187029.1 MAG: hypothetical protein FD163_304 [Hyphomonadaceae bacterium]